ncbi:MAG TPA: glycosyltransferase family 1 protein [Candidatus Limnocylindrales bacterium]|nr:glycosyltransferase family 1 protein [Candidatus Limnocylindrales bacterium]
MRLGIDTRITRYPPGGNYWYVTETARRLTERRPPGWEVLSLDGWPRIARGGATPAPLRRVTNVAMDVGWLGLGATFEAARHRLTAWLTTANMLPPTLPRPMVTIIHDLNFLQMPELYERSYRTFAEGAYRLTAARASRIIVPSEYVRGAVIDLLDVQPSRVRAIPWGLEHVMADAEPAKAVAADLPRPYALFVGQTQPHWNVGALIEAWRVGAGADRGLHLVICGPAGRDDEALRDYVALAGIGGRVHFTGQLPPDVLAAAYRGAEMFLYPPKIEGFGYPALVAMAHGVPTAVSNAGALPETTRDGAVLFDPVDTDGIVELVRRLSDDDVLRRQLLLAGPRVAGTYHWDRTIEGIWSEVLAASE